MVTKFGIKNEVVWTKLLPRQSWSFAIYCGRKYENSLTPSNLVNNEFAKTHTFVYHLKLLSELLWPSG